MSTFVMSDLHGCYDEFIQMLRLIDFNDSDTLILAGDYVDRGSQTLELLDWLVGKPDNVIMLMGNHDQEFVENLQIIELMALNLSPEMDYDSQEDLCELYDAILLKLHEYNKEAAYYFDHYETILDIISENETDVSLNKLIGWRLMLDRLPYVYKTSSNGREVIVVHAGYAENISQLSGYKKFKYEHMEDFYLHARNEAFEFGGKENAIIIAGHTPTTVKGFCYNKGRIYHYYDEKNNCDFYDIDCGVVFKPIDKNSHLACIRIEDMKEYYV